MWLGVAILGISASILIAITQEAGAAAGYLALTSLLLTLATPNHTSSTFGRTPEAHMAILRLVAKIAVVASHANGSPGADIEKNTVIMSRSKTMPKRPSILVRSRSLSWPPRSD
jgi:hypothetical protein